MGLEAARGNAGCRIKIGIVSVEHGAVIDGAAEISRIAAARQELHIDRRKASGLVKARIIGGAEVMALARHDHVVVPVEAAFGGPPGMSGR